MEMGTSGRYGFMRKGGLLIIAGTLILLAYFNLLGAIMHHIMLIVGLSLLAAGTWGIVKAFKAGK